MIASSEPLRGSGISFSGLAKGMLLVAHLGALAAIVTMVAIALPKKENKGYCGPNMATDELCSDYLYPTIWLGIPILFGLTFNLLLMGIFLYNSCYQYKTDSIIGRIFEISSVLIFLALIVDLILAIVAHYYVVIICASLALSVFTFGLLLALCNRSRDLSDENRPLHP